MIVVTRCFHHPRSTAGRLGCNGWALLAATVAAVLVSFACQSSSKQLVGPSGTKCQITLPSNPPLVAAEGGNGSLTITAARECTWSAASDVPWITITAGTSGQGSGVVSYTATGNPRPATRRGGLTIGDRQIEVVQEAAPCHFTMTPSALAADAGGGESLVAINTLDGCMWTATSETNWIAVVGAAEGNGTGALRLHVRPNDGADRTGHVRIAEQLYIVTQPSATAAACVPTISSLNETVGAAGATIAIAVAAPDGCVWTSISHAPWIRVSAGADGVGNAAVELHITANTGPQRVGAATVAGQTFTVTQLADSPAPACSYTLGTSEQSISAGGGSIVVSIAAPGGCAWTAATQVPWMTVTNGAQGSGNGSVALNVAPNSSVQRSGVVTIAGQTFTVNQADGTSAQPCAYTLTPAEQSIASSGASVAVAVTTGSACTWSVTSHASWISVTNGAQRTGSGSVNLNVAANTGNQRSGAVTIAGQTFTVTQAVGNTPVPCSYTLNPSEQSVAASGGSIKVGITTASGCAWTATTQANWLTVASGSSGSGNGEIGLSVAANAGPQRAGTVVIGGQTFTVTQAPAPVACTYAINPTQQSAPSLGGTFRVDVATQAGCAWSAKANVDWIEITGNGNGTGNGTVTYRVGIGLVVFSREGTLTVAGQTLTVTQAGLLITDGSTRLDGH